MNKIEDTATEELIKAAAKKVFTNKGLDGARMQDIADEAKVNKGLVNYYFRSKEKLFHIIFDEAFNALFSNTAKILDQEITLEEKIKQIIKNESEILIANPFLPLFVMNEVGRNHELIKEKINSSPVKAILKRFSKEVAIEVKKGTIRKISGEQLFINMVSMIMFPFIGKKLFQAIYDKTDENLESMLLSRQTEVTTFILHSIRK